MRVPQYSGSSSVQRWQRRVAVGLAVAVAGLALATVTAPVVRAAYWRRQLRSPSVQQQLRAINRLLPSAGHDERLRSELLDGLVHLAERPKWAPIVRDLVRWCCASEALRAGITGRLSTASDTAFVVLADGLGSGGCWDASCTPAEQARRLRLALTGADSTADALAALHATTFVAVTPEIVAAIRQWLDHEDPAVRRVALRALAGAAPHLARVDLQAALSDRDRDVRTTAGDYLVALPCVTTLAMDETAPLAVDATAATDPAEVYAVLRQPDPGAWIPALRRVADSGLRSGHGAVVGAAFDVLAELDDRAMLGVMLEVAELQLGQPLLNWMAARAAARIDPEAGSLAMCRLLASDVAVVRDLAAVALARSGTAMVEDRIVAELFAFDGAARGAAALALALDPQRPTVLRGRSLQEILDARVRLEAGNAAAEREWLPRGYAWCSLAILQSPAARNEVSLFLLNEHFPRHAVFTALLACGDPAPLDIVFDSLAYDAAAAQTLLRDERFADVLSGLIPDAPRVTWWAAEEIRRRQVAVLAAWWTIHRRHLQWDAVRQTWSCPG